MNDFDAKKHLNNYLNLIEEQLDEFSEVKEKFITAYEQLRQFFPNAEKLNGLYEKLTLIHLRFYYALGVEENFKHFNNPENPTFLDKDYDDSFAERKMRESSDHLTAEKEIKKIRLSMTAKADAIYDKMRDYYIFLDTYIPKLAHFYGYIWANSNLQRIVPEFKEDTKLTEEYKNWIKSYLELEL